MRDFRDAKVMARALRDALKAKAVETTHSESLELIAKAFGCANWNVLSAKIGEAGSPAHGAPALAPAGPNETKPPATLFCTFCGKSQHAVRALIAGPSSTYICDECVVVCNDVLDDQEDGAFFRLLAADEESGNLDYPAAFGHVAGQPTEDVMALLERCRRGVHRYRLALEDVQQVFAMRAGEKAVAEDALAAPRFAAWRDKRTDELRDIRQRTERTLKRYQAAVDIAVRVLGTRRQ
jgi:hypothetical protein